MNNKLINLQLLRALAIIAVVLFHCTGFEAINSGIFVKPLQLGAAGVDLFFVLSGFIIWHTTANDSTSLLSFLTRRYLRIMPMYWIISCSLILMMFIKGKTFDLATIATSLLLLPSANYPILNVGWSLIHELYFYSIFSLLLIISSPKIRLTILWVWALLSSSLYFYMFPDNPWLQVITNPFNIEFTLGATLAYTMSNIQSYSYRLWPHCILATLMTLIYWISQFGWYFPESIERVIFFALPISLLALAALASPPASGRTAQLFEKIGDASYSIYLTHVPVLAAIYALAAPTSLQLHVLFALSICLGCGWLCYRWLEQPLMRYLQPNSARLSSARTSI